MGFRRRIKAKKVLWEKLFRKLYKSKIKRLLYAKNHS